MSRVPTGQKVRTLEDALHALAHFHCGVDLLVGPAMRGDPALPEPHATVVRAAVDRSQKRAVALAAADREVAP